MNKELLNNMCQRSPTSGDKGAGGGGFLWTASRLHRSPNYLSLVLQALDVIFNHLGGFGMVFRFLKNEPICVGWYLPIPDAFDEIPPV